MPTRFHTTKHSRTRPELADLQIRNLLALSIFSNKPLLFNTYHTDTNPPTNYYVALDVSSAGIAQTLTIWQPPKAPHIIIPLCPNLQKANPKPAPPDLHNVESHPPPLPTPQNTHSQLSTLIYSRSPPTPTTTSTLLAANTSQMLSIP